MDLNYFKKSEKEAATQKSEASYSETYFKRNDFKKRGCVYISEKNHELFSTIAGAMRDKNITVGGYIDRILSEHIEEHKDEIKEIYQKKKQEEENRFGLI